MDKLLRFIIPFFFLISSCYAAEDKNVFPQKNWSSSGSNDQVVISNGSGMRMMVVITVDGNPGLDAPGAALTNCGDITKIPAGGTAICGINDPRNPLTITTDNVNKRVSGTYQLRAVQ